MFETSASTFSSSHLHFELHAREGLLSRAPFALLGPTNILRPTATADQVTSAEKPQQSHTDTEASPHTPQEIRRGAQHSYTHVRNRFFTGGVPLT